MPRLPARMTEVKAARAKGQPTMPSTMGLEKADQSLPAAGFAGIRKSLGMEKAGDVAVFGEIRRRKDNF